MINQSVAFYGVAKGATATAPTYTHGLKGGEPFSAEVSREIDAVSCGVRASADAYNTERNVASDITTNAYADVTGLYLLGALGNVATTTSGTNKQHVFTVGNTLPDLTIFSQIDGGTVKRITGAKVDQLAIDFNGNEPLQLGLTIAGVGGSWYGDTWSGSGVSCFDGYFTCVGSTIKLSANTSTPAVLGNNIITAGNLTIANNVEAKFGSGSIEPKALAIGKVACSGSMTLYCADEDIQRILETGSASGSALTGGVVYGSFEWLFQHTKETDFSLKITATRVPFMINAMSVDPAGNGLESELTWDDLLIEDADESPVTITLINDVASYTS